MKPEDTAILIVDDETAVRESLCKWFQIDGYRVDTAPDAVEALKKLQEQSWDIIFLDIKMPGMDGLELQRRIKQIDKDVVTIMITAFASVDTSIQALKEGAFDYIVKPIDPDDMSHLIRNAIDHRRLLSENLRLRRQIEEISSPDKIIGESQALKQVMQRVAAVAETDSTAMIRGESGTGKELVARAIHSSSNRRYFPIVTINCGAYAEGLLESELFGHEKGAFTGGGAGWKWPTRGRCSWTRSGTSGRRCRWTCCA
jgi:DNA-binding NtrC family response regulator